MEFHLPNCSLGRLSGRDVYKNCLTKQHAEMLTFIASKPSQMRTVTNESLQSTKYKTILVVLLSVKNENASACYRTSSGWEPLPIGKF